MPRSPAAEGQDAARRSRPTRAARPTAASARVDTAAGVGSEPIHVGGTLYLAGPYKGAPVSSVVVTPALAGPYDLGTVVVRPPSTSTPNRPQLTARSDPIPTILKGIPLKVRSVAINVDRPELHPQPDQLRTDVGDGAQIAGASGATRDPVQPLPGRQLLGPGLQPRSSRSRSRAAPSATGNPALTAVLTQPGGQANIGRVSVTLPHSEFLDQGHIRTVCTRVQFAADACPAGAIYGQAEAISPLLDQPLRGPVYLRSSSNKLPDLVVALRGPASQPIEVNLAGRIDSVNGGIRNSFEVVPDAPVSKFVLRMQGGKKGLLVNSTNICARTNRATVKMEGQNGKLANSRPPLGGPVQEGQEEEARKGTRARGAEQALWRALGESAAHPSPSPRHPGAGRGRGRRPRGPRLGPAGQAHPDLPGGPQHPLRAGRRAAALPLRGLRALRDPPARPRRGARSPGPGADPLPAHRPQGHHALPLGRRLARAPAPGPRKVLVLADFHTDSATAVADVVPRLDETMARVVHSPVRANQTGYRLALAGDPGAHRSTPPSGPS